MYSIGEKVFYGVHGVCVVQDIQELTFSGQKKDYYILHSYHDASIKLYHPVEAKESKLTPIASKDAAELILESFKNPPDEWNERMTERSKHYQSVLESNSQIEIAQMINTILRRKMALEDEEKKLPNQDAQILKQVAPIFCEEIATSLGISIAEVMKKIEEIIQENRTTSV